MRRLSPIDAKHRSLKKISRGRRRVKKMMFRGLTQESEKIS